MTAVFCSRHSKRTPLTKGKEEDRSREKGKRAMIRKPKAELENFVKAAPAEILMERSGLKLHQSPEYAAEKGISCQETMRNRWKDFRRALRRVRLKKRRCQGVNKIMNIC